MIDLLELPLELVLAVVQLLGNEDLRILSLVCRHLRPYCQAVLLQTCSIPITLSLRRSVEDYRILFQTPHFNESIRFLSIRGRPNNDPAYANGDDQAWFAEVAGHIPTLRRLQCIEINKVEPGIPLLDAIFRSTVNKPMKLILNLNTYPEEYTFPAKDLKIYHIEAGVRSVYIDPPEPYPTSFFPRLVSACAATLSSLHIYDDHTYTNMWDNSSVQLRSLTVTATRDPSLVAFLQSQASLEELIIRHDDSRVEGWASKLSGSDLPNLRSVTASFGSLRYLVPGRPIREANPDNCCEDLTSTGVHDFLCNTCPRAAGDGIESVDLGAVLSGSMVLPVLSKSQRAISNIQYLGIPCLVKVRQSHVILRPF